MNSEDYSKKAPMTDVSNHTLDYYYKGMVEELGEFFGHLKRITRDDGGKITWERFQKMIDEMGDFEWYRIRAWTKLCEEAGLDFVPIEKVWQRNINKLADRKDRNKLQGEGSNR
jgi:NTP pyrophosphatase (non-canonical NTP hydrolase)